MVGKAERVSATAQAEGVLMAKQQIRVGTRPVTARWDNAECAVGHNSQPPRLRNLTNEYVRAIPALNKTNTSFGYDAQLNHDLAALNDVAVSIACIVEKH